MQVPRKLSSDPTLSSARARYLPLAGRARSRSHNSRLALVVLGLLACLVALSGGGQDTVAGAAPAGNAIRKVDFSAVAQPGNACAQGLSIAPPKRIAVDAGSSALLDLGRLTRLKVHRAVDYGDLNGDGADEAVVHAECSYGANGSEESVQVWAMRGGDPVLVDTVSPPSARVSGPLPPAVKNISVRKARVTVTWTSYAADDPFCCPTRQSVVRYRLTDGALHQVGRVVTTRVSG